jgi:DNA-binding MarR family transcriptional regulator
MVRCNQSISHSRRIRPIVPTERAAVVAEVIAGYEALMARLADSHAPDFLEIDITMPQAKVLYLLGAAGDLHMSAIVAMLGVSLSTISGLVDRLVDHGLASRRDDPADRRQVVVGLTPVGADFIGRFRELNARQMSELLGVLDDEDLATVRGAMAALDRAAARLSASATERGAAGGPPHHATAVPGLPESPARPTDRGPAARVVPTRKDPA